MAESRDNRDRDRLSTPIGVFFVQDKNGNPKGLVSKYELELEELFDKANRNREDFELFRAYLNERAECRRKGLLESPIAELRP